MILAAGLDADGLDSDDEPDGGGWRRLVTVVPSAIDEGPPKARWRDRLGSVEALAVVIVAVVVLHTWLVGLVDSSTGTALSTVFTALLLQALPFLVFGAVLRAAIVAFVPRTLLDRALRHDLAAAALTSPAISPVVLRQHRTGVSGASHDGAGPAAGRGHGCGAGRPVVAPPGPTAAPARGSDRPAGWWRWSRPGTT